MSQNRESPHHSQSSSGLSSTQEKSSENISPPPYGEASGGNENYKQKSHSYQDLHSDYTKKRYRHVKSKVKEYIANIRAHDRLTKGAKFIRHRSLPETIGSLGGDYDEVTTIPELDSGEYVKQLREKDIEVQMLRNLNEILESNLQEKSAMLAQLKINADMMRFEMLEMKQRQQRGSIPSDSLRYSTHRFSLPNGIIPSVPSTSSNKTAASTISTQTEQEDLTPEISQLFFDVSLDDLGIDKSNNSQVEKSRQQTENFIVQPKEDKRLRRRSHSNSMNPENGSERACGSSSLKLAADCDPTAQTSQRNQVNLEQSIADDEDDLAEPKKRKVYKRSSAWQLLKGPCKRVILCCQKIPDSEKDFVYTRLPIEEIELLQPRN